MYRWVFSCLFFSFFCTQSIAAGFDCNKAATLVENAICSDDELSTLDESMVAAYRDALSNHAEATKQIKDSQRVWLKKRNTCKDTACLKKAYSQRLDELQNQPAQNKSNQLPKKVGQCADMAIQDKVTRFEGAVAGESGGEVNVQLSDNLGLYLLNVAGLSGSANLDKYMYATSDFAKGDKVKVCLIELPTDCPKGDDRGKIYKVTNYKNKKSFTGVDSWHSCGGA